MNQPLPLDVVPASALRRRDRFVDPVTERVCTVAARFTEGDRLMLACADEEGRLTRVLLEPWRTVRMAGPDA